MSSNSDIITSTSNQTVKRLKSLSQKKHREEEGVFLVEGLRHIHDALCSGWEAETFIFSSAARREKLFKGVIYADGMKNKQCLEATDDILSRITGRDNTQPAIATFKQRWHDLNAVNSGLWVGLENIRDPGNLGTIIRTAYAAGADGIILIGDCCDMWSPETIRASMGFFARTKVARCKSAAFSGWRAGWKGCVIGTHLKGSAVDYRTLKYDLPLLLLMGGEQGGLSDDLTNACNSLAKIPMVENAESLNLAVSTGIMLYEINRGRL